MEGGEWKGLQKKLKCITYTYKECKIMYHNMYKIMEGDQEIDRRRRNGGCQDNEWHLREYSVNNHLGKKAVFTWSKVVLMIKLFKMTP